MKKPIRDLIAWLQGFLPMYQMKFRLTMRGEPKTYDASEGTDWFLPRLKKKINNWNEEAMNAGCDPAKDHAYYVRIR